MRRPTEPPHDVPGSRHRPLAQRLLLPLLGLAVFPLLTGTFATVQVGRVASHQAGAVTDVRDRTVTVAEASAAVDRAADLLVDAQLTGGQLSAVRVETSVADVDRAVAAVRTDFTAAESVDAARPPLTPITAGPWPLHGDDTDALYRAADTAMYQAKANGQTVAVHGRERGGEPAGAGRP